MIKQIFKSIMYKCMYGSKSSSESYVNFLRRKGIEIGEGTIFYEPMTNSVDIQNPKILHIGKNVRITRGVVILTHDYSWSVLAGAYGEILGGVSPVIIEDNVFIGVNSCILRGVHIGSNVIIGAGSVVTHDCESDSVYAGIPAKRIMSLNAFLEKKKKEYKNDLRSILRMIPKEDLPVYLREYSCLYKPSSDEEVKILMQDTGYYDKCKEFYEYNGRHYENLDELISDAKDECIKMDNVTKSKQYSGDA